MSSVRVEPLDYATAADQFHGVSTTAVLALGSAQTSLRRYSSMAGDDPGGERFADSYDQGAASILQAMRNLAVMSSQLDRGLMATGATHHQAECRVAGLATGGGFTLRPELAGLSVAPPPSAFGGQPDSTPDLWEMLKDAVGTVWPNADTGKLRQAGASWHSIADDLTALARSVTQSDNPLLGNRSIEIALIQSHVNDLALDVTQLAGHARDIGEACNEYADDVDEAHHEVMMMVAQLAVEIAVGIGISAALSAFTFGIGGAAGAAVIAARIATVAVRIGGLLGKVLSTALRIAVKFAELSARIASIAARFEKTFKIGIEAVSGSSSSMIAEGLFNGKDANYLAAGISGLTGGLASGGITAAFSTRTLNLLGRVGLGAGAGAADGATSSALDGLIRDGKLDLGSIAIGTVLGTVGGGLGGGLEGSGAPHGGAGTGHAGSSTSTSGTTHISTEGGPHVSGDIPSGGTHTGGTSGGPGSSPHPGGGDGAPAHGGDTTPAHGGDDAPTTHHVEENPPASAGNDEPPAHHAADNPAPADTANTTPGTNAAGHTDIAPPDAAQSSFADEIRRADTEADAAHAADGTDGGDGADAPGDDAAPPADHDAAADGQPDGTSDASDITDTTDTTVPDHDPALDAAAQAETHSHALSDELSAGTPGFADDNAAAARYGATEWDGVADALTPDQRASVADYTREIPGTSGITYKEINAALRNGPPYPADIQPHLADIDAALATHPVPEDIVVTRGTGTDHWPFTPDDAAGNSITEASYLSTSLGGPADSFANKDVVLHLRVPQGTPAMWLEDVSVFGGSERELLLGRGLTWRATGSVEIGGQWHVYAEVTP